MIANVANIASKVNQICCDYRPYNQGAISATIPVMETIDRHWIKARLEPLGRGSQARLAAHMGIKPDQLSKIMRGDRDVQQDEMPRVLSFFNARIVTDESESDRQEILKGAENLNSDGLRLLQKQLNEMLETPSLRRQTEN